MSGGGVIRVRTALGRPLGPGVEPDALLRIAARRAQVAFAVLALAGVAASRLEAGIGAGLCLATAFAGLQIGWLWVQRTGFDGRRTPILARLEELSSDGTASVIERPFFAAQLLAMLAPVAGLIAGVWIGRGLASG